MVIIRARRQPCYTMMEITLGCKNYADNDMYDNNDNYENDDDNDENHPEIDIVIIMTMMAKITLRSLTAKRSDPHPGDSKRQQESGTEFL